MWTLVGVHIKDTFYILVCTWTLSLATTTFTSFSVTGVTGKSSFFKKKPGLILSEFSRLVILGS